MEPAALALIAVAGVAMGVINNLAGGGGLLGLLAFDVVAGLPTATANATLRPAALAVGALGYAGFRSRGYPVPPRAWLFGLAAVPGAVLGAVMAIELPALVYRVALAAVIGITVIQQLRPRAKRGSAERESSGATSLLLFTAVGIHMGFLQVAVGLTIMAALDRVHSRDLVAINAAKTAIVISTAIASNAYLAVAGAVAWGPAICLAVGAGAGAFMASRWSVKRGHGAIRAVVLLVCACVAVRLVWQTLTE